MALARELSLRLPLQRGDDVRAVQQALIRAGMLAGSADGIFGPSTHRAVLDFQRRMQARHPGFTADGVIGRQCWSALFPEAAPHPITGAATPEAGLAAAPHWRGQERVAPADRAGRRTLARVDRTHRLGPQADLRLGARGGE